MENIQENKEMTGSCEKSVTAWVSVFISASEDFDFVIHHEWPWFMIHQLGDNCEIRYSRQETNVIEGSSTVKPIEHNYEYDEVWWTVPVS